jgi:hypothetical protein
MAFTYEWTDAVSLVNKMIKGTPTSTIDARVCDMVTSEMYAFRPWGWTLSSGTLCTPTNGNQDYTPTPTTLYRLMRARMTRTDTSPNQNIELDVRSTLAPDLGPRSYSSITAVSYEQGVNKIRLSSAVQVPSGTTLVINGEYQPNPTKITDLGQLCFFPDQYLSTAAEGLMYWYYKLNDDPRAGGKQISDTGRTVYTGQYGAFIAALEDMAEAEDFPGSDLLFPDEPMGVGRSYYGTLNIYGVI